MRGAAHARVVSADQLLYLQWYRVFFHSGIQLLLDERADVYVHLYLVLRRRYDKVRELYLPGIVYPEIVIERAAGSFHHPDALGPLHFRHYLRLLLEFHALEEVYGRIYAVHDLYGLREVV